MRYRVERATSTRASADPDSPDFGTWVHWQAGDGVDEFPPHVDTAALLESGAVTEAEAEKPARGRKGKD